MVKERIQSNLPDAKSKERIESMTGNNKSLTKEKYKFFEHEVYSTTDTLLPQ